MSIFEWLLKTGFTVNPMSKNLIVSCFVDFSCSGKKAWQSGREIIHHEPTDVGESEGERNLTSGLEFNQVLNKPRPWLNFDLLGEISLSYMDTSYS